MPPASDASSGLRHALHVAVRLAQLAGASAAALAVFAREAWRCRREGRDGGLRALARAHVALCERLGATFIKVGQIASTRGDLLPPPIVEELARLRESGARVAVKVRRPDILEKVRLDRAILLVAARAAERVVPSLRLVSLAEAVQTFCDAVEHQIHRTHEAEHNRRFRANFAGDPDVHFPAFEAVFPMNLPSPGPRPDFARLPS